MSPTFRSRRSRVGLQHVTLTNRSSSMGLLNQCHGRTMIWSHVYEDPKFTTILNIKEIMYPPWRAANSPSTTTFQQTQLFHLAQQSPPLRHLHQTCSLPSRCPCSPLRQQQQQHHPCSHANGAKVCVSTLRTTDGETLSSRMRELARVVTD